MLPNANASIRAAIFALLAAGSLGLKAAAGPPNDGALGARPEQFEQTASAALRAQGFAVSWRRFHYSSTLVLGTRGNCRVAVRNAMEGAAVVPAFAQDARSIGTVHYLYEGADYAAPPELRLRLGRLKSETLHRLGWNRGTPILVAFAKSPECGGGDFGLGTIRLNSGATS